MYASLTSPGSEPELIHTILFDLDGTLTDPKVGITRGVQHALRGTSKPDVVAEAILEHFDLRRFFAFIGGAALDGSRRSKHDVIDHTLAAIGVGPTLADRAGVVIVGDRAHDIHGAQAAGIGAIGVRWGYAEPGELEAAGAPVIVDSIADLLGALRPQS